MDKQGRRSMIDYINRLMEEMPAGLLRKLFICACNICGSKGGAADEQ